MVLATPERCEGCEYFAPTYWRDTYTCDIYLEHKIHRKDLKEGGPCPLKTTKRKITRSQRWAHGEYAEGEKT